MGSVTRKRLLIFFMFFFAVPTLSRPTFVIENLNATRFPRIEIILRENQPFSLTEKNLAITEEMEGLRSIPADISVSRSPEKEPIQIVLSIQPTDSKSINQWSIDLAITLSRILEPKDRFHVHIQEEKRFLYLRNQNYNTLRSGLVIPSKDTYIKTLTTISELLDHLTIVGNKPPFLVVLLHSRSVPDRHILVDLAKKARRMGVPVHVMGFPGREALMLAEYTDGKHYSLQDKNSIKKLIEDIQYYKNPPYSITYTSRNKVHFFEEKSIQIDLGVLNVQNLSAEYKTSFYTRLESSLRDPYIFIPTALFFLIIAIAALILLPGIRKGSDSWKRSSSKQTLVPETGKKRVLSTSEEEEERIYEKVYGRKDDPDRASSVAYRMEENSFDTETPSYMESIPGEAYSKAVLIQKEGPSPGRHYNLYGHETYIGRLETNHLVIYDNSVSPVHARIKNIQNKYVLYDMLSLSGVYLNGKKLLRPKVLQDFDEIQIGKTLLIFRGK